MFRGKSVRRAAVVALTLVLCSVAFVTAADKAVTPRPAAVSVANSVIVESQTLMVGIAGSTVGVSISNTDAIAGMVIPLEIRSLTPGASIAQTILFQMNPTGRVANSPLGFADPSVDSLWPEAFRSVQQSCVTCSLSCSGPVSNTYCTFDTSCSFPTDPYGLMFASVSTGVPANGDLIDLAPGADPGTTADASLQIVLTQIGPLPGFFEIDTACWTPANSLIFAKSNSDLIIPSFTKGLIELRCDCSCHADPICDGITNVQDVVQSIDVIFRGELAVNQPYCPFQAVDANCDGFLDVVDVVTYIDVAFRNANPAVAFCDACVL